MLAIRHFQFDAKEENKEANKQKRVYLITSGLASFPFSRAPHNHHHRHQTILV